MTEPCRCPLCRTIMRNLPRGSRTWHCDACSETMTEGYARAWPVTGVGDSLGSHERREVLHAVR